MICPKCSAEYVAGVEQCVDCEVALVHSEQVERRPEEPVEWHELAEITDEHEARLIQGYLESEGVPCHLESLVFHAEPFTFGPLSKVRIHVPVAEATRAVELLETREHAPVTID